MSYLSLYRKYRSQSFDDLIGQDHVVRTLQNALTSDRIAHSYLFTGPRGTGKTSTARLLAKALCCESGPAAEPDNSCPICLEITAGSCVDVIEMDAASDSGVEDIREKIVEIAEYRPMICRYKVFIIDEVHDLSGKAFDALLKTIEEPPEHLIFILATTEYNKVPPTIRSRCQKYEFHRGSIQDLISRLTYVAEKEGIEAEPQALTAIARMADGGYRDALTLLEQAMLTSEGRITLQQVYDQLGLVSEELVDSLLLAIKEADVPAIVEQLSEIARLGRDPRSILESMLYRLADLTRAAYSLGDGTDSTREASLHEAAARVGRDTILRLRAQLSEAHKVIRDISLPRLWFESELVKLATTKDLPTAVAAQPAAPKQQPAAPKQLPSPEPQRAEKQPAAAPRMQVEKTPEDPPVTAVAAVPEAAASPSAIWQRVMEALPPGAPITLKLAGSQAVGQEGNELIVEIGLKTFYEWLTDKPVRAGHINKVLAEQGAEGMQVRFQLAKKSTSAAKGPEVVELPLEGTKLEQVAKEVFAIQND